MLKKAATCRSAGFTLVELMVVIVIATVLLSIAIPAYTSQVRKSRRTEAKTALLDIAAREERYSATNTTYTTSASALAYGATGNISGLSVGSGYYQVTVCVANSLPCTGTATTGSAFLITATPVAGGSQANDAACTSFSVDNTGLQAATGSSAATCWN